MQNITIVTVVEALKHLLCVSLDLRLGEKLAVLGREPGEIVIHKLECHKYIAFALVVLC